MVVPLLLALMGHSLLTPLQRVSGSLEWEEQAIIQKLPGYHPMLRFEAPFEMLGFNQTSRFMFASPNFVAEGHYTLRDGHYYFHPVAAMLIGNREVNMLLAEMDPDTQRKLHKKYADTLDDFEADYNQRTGILFLTYRVDGMMKTFQLHMYTEGDNYVTRLATNAESAMVGLWVLPSHSQRNLIAKRGTRLAALKDSNSLRKKLVQARQRSSHSLTFTATKHFAFTGRRGCGPVTDRS